MTVKSYAYGRVSLLGNPSDLYGGKCISFTFDRSVNVSLNDSLEFKIENKDGVERTLDYNGCHDLIKASINELWIMEKDFHVRYESDIPIGRGLAGSSAIVIATIRALNEHFGLGLDSYQIAERALHTELDHLGIAAGFQDRYVIAFEGVLHMDFKGKEHMRRADPLGVITRLHVGSIPHFLCFSGDPKTSADVHNSLRDRFLSGETTIKDHMDRIGDLANEGIDYLLKADWARVGLLMNKNTELREMICPHRESDMHIIKEALRYGALGAKLAGSGGAVVVLDPGGKSFIKMNFLYSCFKPRIVRP